VKRPVARILALLGAIGIGYLLFSAAPRDVVLVYDLAGTPGASSLEVEIRRGGDVVRHAELATRDGGQLRHPVRLPEGDYVVGWRLTGVDGVRSGERPLEVREDGTVVLSLGR
jgi:methionine-rich copper-binding protein CopC